MAMSSSINASNVSKFLGLISICAQRNRFLGLVFISAFISAQRTSLLGLSMTLQISTPRYSTGISPWNGAPVEVQDLVANRSLASPRLCILGPLLVCWNKPQNSSLMLLFQDQVLDSCNIVAYTLQRCSELCRTHFFGIRIMRLTIGVIQSSDTYRLPVGSHFHQMGHQFVASQLDFDGWFPCAVSSLSQTRGVRFRT